MPRFLWTLGVIVMGLSGCQTMSIKQTHATFEELEGFEGQDLTATAQAFQHSCRRLIEAPSSSHKFVQGPEWQRVCRLALEQKSFDNASFKSFLKQEFDVVRHETTPHSTGLLTGYFQPELHASRVKTDQYKYPIYKRPKDLVVIEDLVHFNEKAAGIRIAGTIQNETFQPYFTRQEINAGSLENQGHEIAWVEDSVDLFFMHIQGSGRLLFQDGSFLNISYHGTNGKAYTAIGKRLIDAGHIAQEDMSMEAIKNWLRHHANAAQKLMETNESYVFFKAQGAEYQDPIGAQDVPLTAFASLAVDPHHIPLGSLVWIAADHQKIGRKMLVAQDVGGAIKGPLRGDFYCGTGEVAGDIAGSLKASAIFYTLIPKVQK